MLSTFAIQNYRSILKLVVPLGKLNLITGPNASGKSNVYRAFRLLAETAQGGVTSAVAREGGLQSTLWAGPEKISSGMRQGRVPVQGVQRNETVRLRLGYGSKEFGYAISLGLPTPSQSAFALDPEIKTERIWAGAVYRPAATLIDRTGPLIKSREEKGWRTMSQGIPPFESMFGHVSDPEALPEVFFTREMIRGWRFYDHFRTDRDAPARQPPTRNPHASIASRGTRSRGGVANYSRDRRRGSARYRDWRCLPKFEGDHSRGRRRPLEPDVPSTWVAASIELRRVVGWHATVSAVGSRPVDAKASVSDGAERAGNELTPRSPAGTRQADPARVGTNATLGGVPRRDSYC
jgi:hypothetical protein